MWLLLGALLLLRVFPRALRDRLADVVGASHYRINARRRQYALINLSLCFPGRTRPQLQRLAKRHFQAHAAALLDIPWVGLAPRARLLRSVEIHGLEHYQAARAAGRAVILLTAHSSALDIGGIALSARLPMVSVFNPFKSDVADWLMFRIRTRFGLRLARREDGLRALIRATRAGDALYYIPDEDLGRQRTRFAEFFGQQKATVPALGRLARACDALVLPCYTWYLRGAGRYRVQLLPALAHEWCADAAADLRRMNAALEEMIGLCPEQYMWTLRLFKTRPDGQRSPYKDWREHT